MSRAVYIVKVNKRLRLDTEHGVRRAWMKIPYSLRKYYLNYKIRQIKDNGDGTNAVTFVLTGEVDHE